MDASGGETVYVTALNHLTTIASTHLASLNKQAQCMQTQMDCTAKFFDEKEADDQAIELLFKRIFVFCKAIST